jgi:hypothetical protein
VGLAILALLNDGGKEERIPAARAKAVDYLLREQESGGRFGPECPAALYNRGIAATALLEVFGSTGELRLREPIEAAIRFIRRRQSQSGGWGYPGDGGGESNTSLSSWPLQALLLARSLGWSDLEKPIEAGLASILRACDEDGNIGYRRRGDFPHGPEGLSSMGTFCLLLAGRASGGVQEGGLLGNNPEQKLWPPCAGRGNRTTETRRHGEDGELLNWLLGLELILWPLSSRCLSASVVIPPQASHCGSALFATRL